MLTQKNIPVLQLQKIKKVFGKGSLAIVAVDSVDLVLNQGEIVLIMGPSGSGKTTLLSIAGGILQPTHGKVKIGNTTITDMNGDALSRIRRENIGFIFQSFNLLSALTAQENVELAANLIGVKGRKAQNLARKLLEDLGLGHRLNALPSQLSGGEKQRVAIARSLINNPDVILADEPTANLDSKIGHEVTMILKDIAYKQNKSILIVSHDNRIMDIADRILWLEDGKFKEIEKMTIDPVCNMTIEKGKYTTKYKRQQYYFCSQGCMDEFHKKPKKFIGTKKISKQPMVHK